MLDDGETIDFCDPDDVFGDCNDLAIEGSFSFLDELLKGTHACTHTHTCNPPGPSNTPHTHTCVHTHTHLFAQQEEGHTTTGHSETLNRTDTLKSSEHLTLKSSETHTLISAEILEDPTSSEKKRPLGNREAVKKYREKKKAHTAYLEEQILQLRTLNQQLVKRLQGQAALEVEVFRLRNLLSEFRGRIDGELGLLHKKDPRGLQPLPGGYALNSCSVPCDGADVPCLHSSVEKKRVSSTSHDPSIAAESRFSCEKASARCKKSQGSRKRRAGKTGRVADMADCIREG